MWDTALTAHALLEVGGDEAEARAKKAIDWLAPLQVLDVKGDWSARRPFLRPGGWAFQYANPYYPDVDDTAVVVTAMDRAARRLAGCTMMNASPAGASGSRECKVETAVGARSTQTMITIISIIFPSPTTARCSIRPEVERLVALHMDAGATRLTRRKRAVC